jgi:hypothetical protein
MNASVIDLPSFKETKSICQIQAMIKHVLKVDSKPSSILDIKAACFGYKDYNTLKGLSDKEFYTIECNLGSALNPFFVEREVGYFDNYSDAKNEIAALIKKCKTPSIWSIYANKVLTPFHVEGKTGKFLIDCELNARLPAYTALAPKTPRSYISSILEQKTLHIGASFDERSELESLIKATGWEFDFDWSEKSGLRYSLNLNSSKRSRTAIRMWLVFDWELNSVFIDFGGCHGDGFKQGLHIPLINMDKPTESISLVKAFANNHKAIAAKCSLYSHDNNRYREVETALKKLEVFLNALTAPHLLSNGGLEAV